MPVVQMHTMSLDAARSILANVNYGPEWTSYELIEAMKPLTDERREEVADALHIVAAAELAEANALSAIAKAAPANDVLPLYSDQEPIVWPVVDRTGEAE